MIVASAYLIPQIVLILVCVWGIALGFKNWPVDRPAAKLLMTALLIRLGLIVLGLVSLLFVGGSFWTSSLSFLAALGPVLSTLIEALILGLLIYAVFRGRPGAELWPFRSG